MLAGTGIAHAPHGDDDPVAAGVAAAAEPDAVALIGPIRSRAVAETVEATAPAGLPLIAPLATWAGVTRTDEPGCDDPADHRGTVFRLLARDTEVAARIAGHARSSGACALVVAGEHEYGVQLDGQLRLAGLPRSTEPADADLVVLCGLAGDPEIERVRSVPPVPVIAFDGIQGAELGEELDLRLALPFAPSPELAPPDLFSGVGQVRLAADLVVRCGQPDRSSLLHCLRGLGKFDSHGDPVGADVWLWRRNPGWRLSPDRALAPV
jgi:hypothetical protein